MHVQIITFNLRGISEQEYRDQVDPIAPAFAGLPGLVSKTWLANPETNTYGGVYVWADKEAMDQYRETDIYRGMLANPHFGNVTIRDFSILEGPTRATRGTAGTLQSA
jgi:quinol monooxygenase YgiN